MKKTLIILTILIIPAIMGILTFISASNGENKTRNRFNQKISERTTFYDNMWKTISQKSKVGIKNDSSFKDNVNIIMTNRQDSDNLLFKMVTESNPNANYSEVSKLYQDLSRTIEAKRNEFFEQEKMLQDIKLEHDNMLTMFPSSLILGILGRKELPYKPITSSRTDDVMRTGKDDNVDVF